MSDVPKLPTRPFMPIAKALLKAAEPHTSTKQDFIQELSWIARRRLRGHVLTEQSVADTVERLLGGTLVVTDVYLEDCGDQEPNCPHHKVVEIIARRPPSPARP